ncbi:O-methyltransferase-domain-containing protein [Aspergillus sergii]|uniref:O-methyltransferase-domain-containing protein n=1 Tax=Aspergillus sergii TaxID=1034303 RepID=A0A5N6XKT2_9EURO|nr:O-methyltransferase-domain-containing protein [Aspergillus sergii]
MDDKGTLAELQQVIEKYNKDDPSSCMRLEDALEKVRRELVPPQIFTMKQRLQTVNNVCIVVALEMGLFQALAVNQGNSLTAEDLSKATGYNVGLIARVMRVITAIGFANETGYQTYTANGCTLAQNNPGNIGGLIISNDIVFPVASRIRQYLQRNKPVDVSETPPAYDFAMGESIWQTLAKNTEWKTGFDNNMTARNKTLSVPWHLKYPVGEMLSAGSLSAKPIIVDVGGNQGVDLQRFADTFPDLECELILQDLPETIAGIPGQLDSRIKPTAHDFFTEQTAKGADIYYLKSILHDWDDVASRKILSNIAKVMQPHSRLLINEMILADVNESMIRSNMDMLMLFLTNGMERTQTQWNELLATVEPPLKLAQVWSATGDQQCVIETCLAE